MLAGPETTGCCGWVDEALVGFALAVPALAGLLTAAAGAWGGCVVAPAARRDAAA